MNTREVLTFVPLIAAALWIGLYPKPLMEIMDAPVHKLVEQVQPGFHAAEALAAKQAAAAKAGMQALEAPAHHEEAGEAAHGEGHEEKAETPAHGGHE